MHTRATTHDEFCFDVVAVQLDGPADAAEASIAPKALRLQHRASMEASLFQQLVDTASRLAADHVAVIDAGSRLSYAELIDASSSFCNTLAAAGIKPGDRVGVILGNQREFLIAAFGTWRLGAVLAPLNPQFREAEIHTYASASSIGAMVTSPRNASMISGLRARGSPIEHAWFHTSRVSEWTYDGVASSSITTQRSSPSIDDPHSPALTQYSSGSTGRPKRVTRTHGQMLGEVASVGGVLEITPADRILGVAPFFHSYGLMVGALSTLLRGGTLYAVDSFLPAKLAELIERDRVTGLPGVPFMFQLLSDPQYRRNFSSLRFALSAGAPLSEAAAMAFQTAYGLRPRTLYGTTETGVISVRDEHDASDDIGSVGRPIPGVTVAVMTDDEQPAPTGQTGRIHVTSPFAASAYDNDAHSKESYFKQPYFIPGDLGQLSPSGEVLLRGRERLFMNVNGYKVDPVEVEQVLLQLPQIKEAVVLEIADEIAGETIKAVLVTEGSVSSQTIRAHCANLLAPFKCPHVIELRTELPRNALGKVLRKYLLDPTSAPSS